MAKEQFKNHPFDCFVEAEWQKSNLKAIRLIALLNEAAARQS